MAGESNRDFDAEVLSRMAEGESLRQVCSDLKQFGCPSASRFCQRVLEDESFASRYARARDLQAEAWSDLIREQSQKSRAGEIVTEKADGGREVKTVDCVDRSRLEVDSLKWLLAKLHPKKYGDKVQHANESGDGPMEIVVMRGHKPKAPDASQG